MEIIELHLAGFRHHPEATDLYLSGVNRSLMDSVNSDLDYYFGAILGIIFGFDDIEKEEFRAANGSNIYTGLVRIQLDDRIFVIERDFETDIMACMMEGEGTGKVIFHDRDMVHNGKQRTYLAFLRKYFPFTDKALIVHLTYALQTAANPTLRDVLDKFFLICEPRLLMDAYKLSLHEYRVLLNHTPDEKKVSGIRKKLLHFENKKQRIRSSLKLDKQIDQLDTTIRQWQEVQNRIREKQNDVNQLQELLDQKFPLLKDFNGEQLRKDVIVWQELLLEKADYDKRYNTIQKKIDKLEKSLNGELVVYRDIPVTFETDIVQYHEASDRIKRNSKQIHEIKNRLNQLEGKSKAHKRQGLYIGITLPLLAGLFMYFIVQSGYLISAGAFLATAIFYFLYYGSVSTRLKSELWIENHEQSKLRDENAELERLTQRLRGRSILVDDYDHRETHIVQHKKAREIKRNLENLKAEQYELRKNWTNNDGFKKIEFFEKEYGKIIDLNRPNLIEYIENFAESKQVINRYRHFDERLIRKVSHYLKGFMIIRDELFDLEQQMLSTMSENDKTRSAGEILDDIEKNISRLKQNPKR